MNKNKILFTYNISGYTRYSDTYKSIDSDNGSSLLDIFFYYKEIIIKKLKLVPDIF